MTIERNQYSVYGMFMIFILFTCLFASEAGNVQVQAPTVYSVVSENLLRFELNDYEMKAIDHLGKKFIKPVIRNAGSISAVGEPFLPSVSTFYRVEPGKTYTASVEITDSEIITDLDLFPLQTWDKEDQSADLTLKRKSAVYYSKEQYPSQLVQISEPQVLRDITVVRVTFTPFIYSPDVGELTVINSANIELISKDVENQGTFIPQKPSKAFEALYQSFVVNHSRTTPEIGYQVPSILYILPNNSSGLMTTLEVLFNWRQRLGYLVNFASLDEIGTTSAAIKYYINTAYATWEDPPEYVVLVGDVSGGYGIPTYYENWSVWNGEGDHPYTMLVGNDILPEVFIGRLSFSTTTELATIINRTVQYESNPYMGENWFTRACMVGDTSPSGVSVIFTNESIRELMEYNGYDDVRTVYQSPFPSQMISNLNDGVSFFNYRGFYGVSGFSSGDINSLTNGFKLPIATVITCGTGSFAYGTSISESFIRAGTPTQPKGAVAAIATATLGTHTIFNNVVDMGFYYGVFGVGAETVGAGLAFGLLNLYLQYPTDPNNYVSIYTHWTNLMGDPSLRMWTDIPQYFSVSYVPNVDLGTNYFTVQVNDIIGEPVEDAYVTILKPHMIFHSDWTDNAGNVTLPLEAIASGEVLVTVSKKNYYPHQGSFQILSPAVSVNVLIDSIQIDDDDQGNSNGNNNGFINYGETIELTVPLRNYGSETGFGISAILSTDKPFVTLITDSAYIDSIGSDTSAIPSIPFVFQLLGGQQEMTDLRLELRITDSLGTEWIGLLNLKSKGSFVTAIATEVIDLGDGVLSPGETAYVQITLSNEGSVTAGNVSGSITCSASEIEILDADGYWGDLLAGQLLSNSTNRFSIAAGEEAISGMIVYLNINITGYNGINKTEILPFQIGIATVNDPLGPDEAGYYIYDSGDQIYGVAPYFNWFEIDGRYDGPGNQLAISDGGDNQDDVVTISLPFTFKMYGANYDQISICSNGWIAMGHTDMASFRNLQIPGAGGPSPMIAAFWDDLVLGYDGRIYTYYNQPLHQFIVEWSRVHTYDKNHEETFQVILKDPQYYFTPTGDGEILIQYLTFNNTSSGNYNAQVHGNYATIGIEDPSATIGLQYSFNNDYPLAAMPLTDETAILITTRGGSIRMRGDVNQDNILDIMDILVLVDFILGSDNNLNPYLADMNGDGLVNILDMIGIVQAVMDY